MRCFIAEGCHLKAVTWLEDLDHVCAVQAADTPALSEGLVQALLQAAFRGGLEARVDALASEVLEELNGRNGKGE
ncbi:MAG: hypothetical protein AB7K24_20225 [Gemmataceae bacterium]